MQALPAGEVQTAALHDVERPGLPSELSQHLDIVNAARRDDDDRGKAALAGEQRVEFEGGLVLANLGPREAREAQVNGGGIQRVGGGLEIGAERVFGVKRGGLGDEDLGEAGKEAPVALLVGIGQGAAGDGLAETGVVKFGAQCGQTGFDVAETFALGELGKSEHEEVFVGGLCADEVVAVVTGDALVELVFGQEVEALGEDGATFVRKVKNPQACGKSPRKTDSN